MEIVIGIIGLIIAALTFKYTFFRKPEEELQHLKVQFKSTQSLSLQVQNRIRKYIETYDAKDELMFNGVTFGDYLRVMEKSYRNNLSDDLYHKINSSNMPKNIMLSMIKSLETQFEALQQIDYKMRLLQSSIAE